MQGKRILMLVGEYSEEYEIFVFEQGSSSRASGRYRLSGNGKRLQVALKCA